MTDRRSFARFVVALLRGAFLFATSGRAQSRPTQARQLTWHARYQHVGWPHGASASLFGAGAVAIKFGLPLADRNWSGGVLFDDALRDLLRARTTQDRYVAATVGEWVWYGAMAWPALDVLATLILLRSPDVAWQTFVIDLEAFAVSSFVIFTAQALLGRERPYVVGCAAEPSYDGGCTTAQATQSFYSGHTALAFTGAALVCTHHALRVFGGWPDELLCGVGVAAATATGVLRIVSDRHGSSDVLIGAFVGIATGWLLPTLLRYDALGARRANRRTGLMPLLASGAVGLAYGGALP